jgi:hypothetical protein
LAQLSKPKIVDDTTVKKKIMEQYGFVDKEEDARYHRPNVSKKCVSWPQLCFLLLFFVSTDSFSFGNPRCFRPDPVS